MNKTDKLIRFPKNLLDKIEAFQKSNSITTFTAAVFELIRRGLNH